MHLGELELSLGANSLGKAGVADQVAERLARKVEYVRNYKLIGFLGRLLRRKQSSSHARSGLPFGLGLFNGIALVVVTNQTGVDKPREIKLLRAEHRRHFRHVGGCSSEKGQAIWRSTVGSLSKRRGWQKDMIT